MGWTRFQTCLVVSGLMVFSIIENFKPNCLQFTQSLVFKVPKCLASWAKTAQRLQPHSSSQSNVGLLDRDTFCVQENELAQSADWFGQSASNFSKGSLGCIDPDLKWAANTECHDVDSAVRQNHIRINPWEKLGLLASACSVTAIRMTRNADHRPRL